LISRCLTRASDVDLQLWAAALCAGTPTSTAPRSGSGPTITAGWHTLARVWDGQQLHQYVDGVRTNTVAVTGIGSWTVYKWGWQFSGSQVLDEAYLPCFDAAWDDAMVARWSANPLGMLLPEMMRRLWRHAPMEVGHRPRHGGRWWSRLQARPERHQRGILSMKRVGQLVFCPFNF
jgi:hypothetical protein